MGKGRDKRKKKEEVTKTVQRAQRQLVKLHKRDKRTARADGAEGDDGGGERFNNEENVEVTLNRRRRGEEKKKTTMELEHVPPPSPRANVVFVPHPQRDGELLIFGGELWNGELTEVYNDLYTFNVARNQWTKLDAPVNPAPRSSSQGVTYKQYLIIFGGEFVSQSQSQYLHFKDVWRYDTAKFEWEELKTLKGGPSSRSGHRMCLWRRSAVVFGGFYDNALECRYFNDLWVLSQMDSAGTWTRVEVAPHSEVPHARSGHSMAVHNDTVFVFGGYSTEKFNRFKKSEATVHHDLWMLSLPDASEASANMLPLWTKLRLGGIPPPIRSGVGFVCKDRRLYLFGGVVDIESPGGKLVSTFHNDMFVLHLDSKRFYPVVLSGPKKGGKSGDKSKKTNVGASLADELKALNLEEDDNDDSSASDDDNDGDDDDSDASATGANADQEMKTSYETLKNGVILPHRRMDCALCASGNQIYLFGGQFESGKKEVSMSDLFSLNTNTLDTYKVILSQDLSTAVWLGKESESNAGSWESGSTVVTGMADFDLDEEEEEDDEDQGGHVPRLAGGGGTPLLRPREALRDEDDDEDNPPEAIPAELDFNVTPALDNLNTDGRTTIKGKKGMKVHKEQLLAQLSAGSGIPTPLPDENATAFFTRTQNFWMISAFDALGVEHVKHYSELPPKRLRRLQRNARAYATQRYAEAKELLEQLKLVEDREKEELEFFRQRRAEKEREWEEYERQQREMEEQERREQEGKQTDDDDDDDDEE